MDHTDGHPIETENLSQQPQWDLNGIIGKPSANFRTGPFPPKAHSATLWKRRQLQRKDGLPVVMADVPTTGPQKSWTLANPDDLLKKHQPWNSPWKLESLWMTSNEHPVSQTGWKKEEQTEFANSFVKFDRKGRGKVWKSHGAKGAIFCSTSLERLCGISWPGKGNLTNVSNVEPVGQQSWLININNMI